jgi:hypothetical protein
MPAFSVVDAHHDVNDMRRTHNVRVCAQEGLHMTGRRTRPGLWKHSERIKRTP